MTRIDWLSSAERRRTSSRRAAQGALVLEAEDLARDLGGDVGVAVAVAADPVAEADRAAEGGVVADADCLEGITEGADRVREGAVETSARGSR